MKLHIDEISQQVKKERHAVLVVDGARWHQEHMSRDNVSVLKLPPYSLELNPVEQVWQWLKQHYLSNRCFKNYNEIVEACCEAWNKFSEQPDLIKSIGTRKWTSC